MALPLRTSNFIFVPGFALVDVLAALAIFATASVGLYFAMSSMNDTMAIAMQRDIEATYANMGAAEVNPFDPAIETAYDVGVKTPLTLPNSAVIYYTRSVDSSQLTSDIKNVNLLFYRGNANGATPYRQIRREVQADFFGFCGKGIASGYYKDVQDRFWAGLDLSGDWVTTAGALRNGTNPAANNWTAINTGSTISNTTDSTLYQNGFQGNTLANNIDLGFFVNYSRSYRVIIGFAEIQGALATQRKMNITINGNLVDTVDPVTDAGGALKALEKSYTVVPTTTTRSDGLQAGFIEVVVSAASGATQPPAVAFIGVERKPL